MELNLYELAFVGSEFGTVGVLALAVLALVAAILVLAHVIGPKRHGPVKDSTYEAGMEPFTDARRRFHVRFYLVAVMYVVFGVEVVFLYPWAVVYAQLGQGLSGQAPAGASEAAGWARELAQRGYGPGFMLGAILVFFALLAVGFVYEWRRGIFKWD